MTVKVEVSQKKINEITRRLRATKTAVTSKRILKVILLNLKQGIFLRTISGRDKNNVSFFPYSADYAEQEGKTLVNLLQSEDMLNSMTQKVLTNDTGKIFFSRPDMADRAEDHIKGRGNLPVRDFFGLSPEQEIGAVKLYQREVNKELKRKNVGAELA